MGETHYPGDMDEIRFYSRKLSNEEIQTLYSYPLNRLIPDTGQTISHMAGDDGSYSINPPRYTELSGSLIFDNITNLTWQKNDSGTSFKWSNGDAFDECNNSIQGGYSDWRLPTIWELNMLVDFGSRRRALTDDFFSTSNNVWSATEFSSSIAWSLDFIEGEIKRADKTDSKVVRCVRGGVRAGSDLVEVSNVILDKYSGLMWQRYASSGEVDWTIALNGALGCENLFIDNYNDWRLPTIKELISIANFEASSKPFVFPKFRGDTESARYWSSTTRMDQSIRKWRFQADDGTTLYSTFTNDRFFRCVRGGIVE